MEGKGKKKKKPSGQVLAFMPEQEPGAGLTHLAEPHDAAHGAPLPQRLRGRRAGLRDRRPTGGRRTPLGAAGRPPKAWWMLRRIPPPGDPPRRPPGPPTPHGRAPGALFPPLPSGSDGTGTRTRGPMRDGALPSRGQERPPGGRDVPARSQPRRSGLPLTAAPGGDGPALRYLAAAQLLRQTPQLFLQLCHPRCRRLRAPRSHRPRRGESLSAPAQGRRERRGSVPGGGGAESPRPPAPEGKGRETVLWTTQTKTFPFSAALTARASAGNRRERGRGAMTSAQLLPRQREGARGRFEFARPSGRAAHAPCLRRRLLPARAAAAARAAVGFNGC